MKERPILFSAPMVRAIQAGHKTQTRRVVKARWFDHAPEKVSADTVAIEYHESESAWREMFVADKIGSLYPKSWHRACPYGEPGDRLWVRENGWEPYPSAQDIREGADTWPAYAYDADMTKMDFMQAREWHWRRRPSIHMPRWASRLTLEIVSVRVERLNMITAGDAEAEGVDARDCTRIEAFQRLWDGINAKRGYPWASNPWVWVVEWRLANGEHEPRRGAP